MSRVSVFGLGYVGVICSACFSEAGHKVIGVDLSEEKVNIIKSGRSPIIEKGVETLLAKNVRSGRLKAITECREAVLSSDMSLICVGTPSNSNGSLNLSYVERVCREIGHALKGKERRHIVVIRSTVLPGTIEARVVPIIEDASGKKAGEGFGIVMNPEFLRESSAIYDFYNPPKTVVGAMMDSDAEAVALLYQGLPGEIIKTSLKVAEMVKYADNAFHALKIIFGNEIGAICKRLEIDSHSVMEIFCKDTKLNLSPYYLKPGFAFGGSCLPKDVRSLTYEAQRLDVEVPVLNSIMESNQKHIARITRQIMSLDKKKIGVLGFAFKAGTDDLRESPMVELIEALLGKGFDIRIYDECVSLAALFGANKEYIENRIPHIAKLMVQTAAEIVEHADVIVIGNSAPEFKDVLSTLRSDQTVVDLVRIADVPKTKANYSGIAW